MREDTTRVLVVHRNRDLAQRIRRHVRGLDRIDLKFIEQLQPAPQPLPEPAPDAIVLDLTAMRLQASLFIGFCHRSFPMPPLVIFRVRSGQRTKHRHRERWRVGEGLEALETGIHAALGRTPHEFSWLPVRFAGTHLVADLPNTHVVVDGHKVSISAREGEVLGLLLQDDGIYTNETAPSHFGCSTQIA
jgi:hypothetical protein